MRPLYFVVVVAEPSYFVVESAFVSSRSLEIKIINPYYKVTGCLCVCMFVT